MVQTIVAREHRPAPLPDNRTAWYEGLRRLFKCGCFASLCCKKKCAQSDASTASSSSPRADRSSHERRRRPASRESVTTLPGQPEADSGGLPIRRAASFPLGNGRNLQHAPTRIRRQQTQAQSRNDLMQMLPSELRQVHQQRDMMGRVGAINEEPVRQQPQSPPRSYTDPQNMMSYRWQQERHDMEAHQGFNQEDESEGSEPRPARPLSKEEIKKVLASYPIVECTRTEQDPCVICLEEFEEEEQMRVLPCFHRFHPECIALWACSDNSTDLTCPTCKTSFAPDDTRHQGYRSRA